MGHSDLNFLFFHSERLLEGLVQQVISSMALQDKQDERPWDLSFWDGLSLRSSICVGVLISDDLKTLGPWAIFEINEESTSGLLKVYCPPKLRQKGLSKQVLIKSFHQLRSLFGVTEIFLEVSSLNDSALKLYNSLGFTEYHCVSAFFSDGSDALKMACRVG